VFDIISEQPEDAFVFYNLGAFSASARRIPQASAFLNGEAKVAILLNALD
jgi:hypothetical protein